MRPVRAFAGLAAVVLSAAAVLGLGPLLYRLSPLAGSLGAVALAIALACAVSGGATSLAVGTGALGSLAGALLGGVTAPSGGAVLLGAIYVDRLLRVRGRAAGAAHLVLSLVAGAGAAQIVHTYIGAPLPVRLVALSMAVVVALLPLLVPADDALAHTLESLARDLPPDLTRLLREAADLRRQVHDVVLPPAAQANAVRSWRTLRELAQARTRLEAARKVGTGRLGTLRALTSPPSSLSPIAAGGTGDIQGAHEDAMTNLVERRIEEHVAALARAYSSVDSAYAVALGLDAETLAAVAPATGGSTGIDPRGDLR
jgi:hypothetical protein